ncbi:MAG: 3-deoxy-D-manno-octulosonic acid transferase, partial [Burkholderiales bacterium]
TEMWPNLLSTLIRRGTPTFLVSGRFSPRAASRYRLLRPLFRPLFQNLTLCCMQTRDDAERLVSAGASSERVLVTGNFKVDNVVLQAGDQGYRILQATGLANRPLFIAASTHPGEEIVVLHAYRQLRAAVPNLLLLLAPRHPQRFPEVERLLERERYRYTKRSRQEIAHTASPEVLLLDTLGELASFYPAAAVAFVGGSLVKGPGGHSVIEPALARTPVCFGPYMRNFAGLAAMLHQEGGGMEVHNAEDLYRYALPLLTDASARQEAGARAYAVIQRQQGAVERTLIAVREWMRTRNVNWS